MDLHVQSQKKGRSLKFRSYEEKELYYPKGKNKALSAVKLLHSSSVSLWSRKQKADFALCSSHEINYHSYSSYSSFTITCHIGYWNSLNL